MRFDGKTHPRRITKLRMDEISLADQPAHDPARVVIMKRADDNTGALASPVLEPDQASENPEMTDEKTEITQDQIDEITKRAERAEAVVKMSPEQRAHFDALPQDEQDEFLAKSDADRDEVLKGLTEADPVVYKNLDGIEIRKSAGEDVLRLTQSNDELRKSVAASEATAKRATFEKRATDELAHLTGDDVVKADLLEAVDGLDTEKRDAVMAVLKSKDAGMQKAFTTVGTEAPGDAKDANETLEAMAKSYNGDHPELTSAQAYVAVLETPEGQKLQAQI